MMGILDIYFIPDVLLYIIIMDISRWTLVQWYTSISEVFVVVVVFLLYFIRLYFIILLSSSSSSPPLPFDNNNIKMSRIALNDFSV